MADKKGEHASNNTNEKSVRNRTFFLNLFEEQTNDEPSESSGRSAARKKKKIKKERGSKSNLNKETHNNDKKGSKRKKEPKEGEKKQNNTKKRRSVSKSRSKKKKDVENSEVKDSHASKKVKSRTKRDNIKVDASDKKRNNSKSMSRSRNRTPPAKTPSVITAVPANPPSPSKENNASMVSSYVKIDKSSKTSPTKDQFDWLRAPEDVGDDVTVEEFEPVANARPALGTIKTRKLKWKYPQDEFGKEKGRESSVYGGSEKHGSVSSSSKGTPSFPDPAALRKSGMGGSPEDDRESASSSNTSSSNSSHHTSINLNNLSPPNPLPPRVPDEQSVEIEVREADVLRMFLDVCKRYSWFSDSLEKDQHDMVKKFFANECTNATKEVVKLLSQSFDYVILCMKDCNDKKIKECIHSFLKDKRKAKIRLMDLFLHNPQLVPECWGGQGGGLPRRAEATAEDEKEAPADEELAQMMSTKDIEEDSDEDRQQEQSVLVDGTQQSAGANRSQMSPVLSSSSRTSPPVGTPSMMGRPVSPVHRPPSSRTTSSASASRPTSTSLPSTSVPPSTVAPPSTRK